MKFTEEQSVSSVEHGVTRLETPFSGHPPDDGDLQKAEEMGFGEDPSASVEYGVRREDSDTELSPEQGTSGHSAEMVPVMMTDASEIDTKAKRESRHSEVHQALRWGGRFKTSLLGKYDRDVTKYTNEELGVHGLKEAFDGTNGWGRTLLYLVCFTVFGFLFLWLTIPLVREYMDRTVITSVSSVGVMKGAPLPIVTVCPMGRGITCDCLLWRRLHCRYLSEKRNFSWMVRFDRWSCWPNFDFVDLLDGQFPRWKDARCEDFLPNSTAVLEDTCGPTASDKLKIENWSQYTEDSLFNTIVLRESLPDGPFVTNKELMIYGSIKLEEKVTFYRTSDVYVEWIKDVNRTLIERDYHEWSRMKRCVQLRIPPDYGRQHLPGSNYGILAVVTGIRATDFPLLDMSRATAAVEVNTNYVRESRYNDSYFPVEANDFISIPAGSQSTLEFELETLVRKPGWGSPQSRQCSSTRLPRSLCLRQLLVANAAVNCNCSRSGPSIPGGSGLSALDCSATEGTVEYNCVIQHLRNLSVAGVPLSICPEQCENLYMYPVKHTTVPLTLPQIVYLKNIEVAGVSPTIPLPEPLPGDSGNPRMWDFGELNPFDNITEDSTIMLRVGLGRLDLKELSELPSLSIGALLGSIGGNAGLWCGISFSLIVEIVEFGLMGFLYGNGILHRGGQKIGRSLRRSVQSTGRAKRSKR